MDIVSSLKNVRRQVATFSLAAMIASFFAIGVAQAQTFPDVQPGDWFYSYVEDLVAMGVVNGSMPEYRPADNVNRAEMAKLVVEAFDIPLEDPDSATFKDVAKSEWFYSYVETAAANGVVGGYKDVEGTLTGYYGPGDDVTREQAAKMIVLGAPLTTNTNCGPSFPDVPMSAWSYEYVETLFVNSVIDGYPDGTYGPTKAINRAEIAKIVSNGMNPVLRPCGGFNVDDAFATSKTTVEVCYNAEYDETSAMMAENYSIVDVDTNALAVSSVAMTSDPMCVELTTDSQTESKSYDLMVTGVTSADGMDLGINDASFTGFLVGGTGGGLTCEAGTQPDGLSVPKGATGVPFTVVNCTADAPTVINSMKFHRFGAGDEGDIADVYLYEGANRLTTGRSINSETQEVELSGLNFALGANQNASFVVVGDIALAADSASQHGFELLNKDSIQSNASSISGSYPIKGNLMTISGATAGTVSVEANGSLDELTIGETGRIAQFEIENSGTESAKLERMALYVRGTCDSDDLTNFNLFVTGNSEVLATAAGVGSKDLASFDLVNPYVFDQGESRIFYVEAKNTCRNGETIKTYIDETTDVHVVGTAAGAGFGLRVDISAPLPGNYDGAGTGFSEVTVKGSDFNIAFSGPPAQDIAVGTDDVSCLDLTLTNASGSSLELRDWEVILNVTSGATVAGGLIDTTGTAQANYTLIKLARMNEDGSVGGSLLGPSELSTVIVTTEDTLQTVVLDGSGNIAPDETIDAAIVFDLNNNVGMNGDKIKCTLVNTATAGKDFVRDENGDELGAESITPATDIPGNTMTVSSAALDVDVASTPSSRTYVSGTTLAALAGFTLTSGTSSGITLESLTVTSYVDSDIAGTPMASDGTAEFVTFGDNANTAVKDVVYNMGLYMGDTLVSDLENVNSADGKIIFNNLSIDVAANDNIDLMLKGTINNAAPYGAANDRLKFAVAAGTDVVATQLSNGQNVATGSIDVTGAANGGDDASLGVVMTIAKSGSGTVSNSTTPQSKAVAGNTTIDKTSIWTFSSVNQDAILNDLQLLVLNDSPAAVSSVNLYTGSDCGTLIKTKTPLSSGIVDFPNLGVTIPEATSLTLCASAMTGTVNNNGVTEPTSASNIGLGLFNVTEVLSGSGDNAAAVYVGTPLTTQTTLDADISAACTDLSSSGGCGLVVGLDVTAVGDVIQIDGEMILVTAIGGGSGTEPTVVLRGFANTTASAHTSGADASRSTVANLVTVLASATADNQFKIGDVTTNLTKGAPGEYCMITSITVTGVVDTYTLEGVFGTLTATCAGHLPYAAADVVTAFQLHGNLHKLFRAVPKITSNVPGGSPALAPSGNTTIHQFSVEAVGDEVRFRNNGAGGSVAAVPGALAVTGANQLVVNLSAGAAMTAGGSCTLVRLTGGEQNLSTVASIAAATQDMAFTFDTNQLDVAAGAGNKVDLEVRCDTTTIMTALAAGSTMTASLPAQADGVEWGTTVSGVTDLVGFGTFVVPVQLTGYTVQKPI